MIFRVNPQSVNNDLLKKKLESSLIEKNLTSSESDHFINSPEGVIADLEKLKIKANISPDKQIFSDKKIIGKFIVFFKKVIRKFLRFYIVPIVDDQNNINDEQIDIIKKLTNIVAEQQREIKKIKEELSDKEK